MTEVLGQDQDSISKWLQTSGQIKSITKLLGDASIRRYYRIVSNNGLSTILMKTEPFNKEGLSYPFLVIQKHLADAQVDVPKILDVDPTLGFILLEDLGDITLLKQLQDISSAEVERHTYERVIDQLISLQINGSPSSTKAAIEAFGLRFDEAKLMWEVRFTIEHFYKGYLKRTLSEAAEKTMESSFLEICLILQNEPAVLTHRDFHSRNIMVLPKQDDPKDNRFVMIDFQDARLGPAQYDLVSLLKDSYYQLDENQIDRLIDYYILKLEAESGNCLDRSRFKEVFDLMTIQRNFKAIGSFASFLTKRGETSYLKYIGNTFENIRKILLKHQRFKNLREVLFHYYYF